MVLSQNGWQANDINLTQNYTIGNGRIVRLRKGDAGYLLKHLADWFDEYVEDIDKTADDWGYAERMVRGSTTVVSNHASGTAIDLNATRHPRGAHGTFTPAQVAAIHQRLKLYDGAIRWGGDYVTAPVDAMHFEINANAATVARVAARLRAMAAQTYHPASKPKPATGTPTYLDITLALQHLAATTRNPAAKPIYERARTIIGKLVRNDTSIRIPETTGDVLAVLAYRRDHTPLTASWTRYRLSTAIRLLRPLA